MDNPHQISCDIIDDEDEFVSRSIKKTDQIDQECPFVAGMYTLDQQGHFQPVRSNYVHQLFASNTHNKYWDDIDVWVCITSDFEQATQIYPISVDKSTSACWFIMHLPTLEAYHIPSRSMYSLKQPRIDISETFIVPFYTYNNDDQTFDILQFKDVFKTNGAGVWLHHLDIETDIVSEDDVEEKGSDL